MPPWSWRMPPRRVPGSWRRRHRRRQRFLPRSTPRLTIPTGPRRMAERRLTPGRRWAGCRRRPLTLSQRPPRRRVRPSARNLPRKRLGQRGHRRRLAFLPRSTARLAIPTGLQRMAERRPIPGRRWAGRGRRPLSLPQRPPRRRARPSARNLPRIRLGRRGHRRRLAFLRRSTARLAILTGPRRMAERRPIPGRRWAGRRPRPPTLPQRPRHRRVRPSARNLPRKCLGRKGHRRRLTIRPSARVPALMLHRHRRARASPPRQLTRCPGTHRSRTGRRARIRRRATAVQATGGPMAQPGQHCHCPPGRRKTPI